MLSCKVTSDLTSEMNWIMVTTDGQSEANERWAEFSSKILSQGRLDSSSNAAIRKCMDNFQTTTYVSA